MRPLFPSSSSLTSPRAGEARGEGLGGPEAGAWRGWGPVWVVSVGGTAHREGEGKARGSGGGADGGGTYPWAEGWGGAAYGAAPAAVAPGPAGAVAAAGWGAARLASILAYGGKNNKINGGFATYGTTYNI